MAQNTILSEYQRNFGGRHKVYINADSREAKVVLHVGSQEITAIAKDREFDGIKNNAEQLNLSYKEMIEQKLTKRAYGRYVMLLMSRIHIEDFTYKAGFFDYEIFYKEQLFCHTDVDQGKNKNIGKAIQINAKLAEDRISSLFKYPSMEDLAILHGIFK